jgi:hypothetical protein
VEDIGPPLAQVREQRSRVSRHDVGRLEDGGGNPCQAQISFQSTALDERNDLGRDAKDAQSTGQGNRKPFLSAHLERRHNERYSHGRAQERDGGQQPSR